ncbi:hypothetical protein [Amycolatopsis sp. NPDC058986]|uniref:hypothetical protein n=1 Tax=unclassified Amycolatopsis TaxID=2618356 RepID=UPI00366CAB8C
MPIRTERGRSAAVRQTVGVMWRSPRNLLVAIVIAGAVIGGIALAGTALRDATSHPAADQDAPRSMTPSSSSPVLAPIAPTPPTTTSSPTGIPSATSTTPAVPQTAPPSAATLPNMAITAGALGFVRSWARPPAGTSAATWKGGVLPFVMPEATAALDSITPDNIPVTRITGDPVVVSANDSVAQAKVPTDAGDIMLTLVRTEQRWLVRTWDLAGR